jgi:hypothetical protein
MEGINDFDDWRGCGEESLGRVGNFDAIYNVSPPWKSGRKYAKLSEAESFLPQA